VRLRGAWKKGLCSRSGYLASEGGAEGGPGGYLEGGLVRDGEA